MKQIILSIFLIGFAWGQNALPPSQNPNLPRYEVTKETALVATTEKITVQATTTSDAIYFEQADVYCSVACVITFSQNGTAATATTLAIKGPIGPAGASPGTAWSSSDVGAGTTLKSFNIPAGGTASFDISMFTLAAQGGTRRNLSIGTDSITGTVRIQMTFRQKFQ